MKYYSYSIRYFFYREKNCSCFNPTSTPVHTLPPSYNQLGAAQTLEELSQQFLTISGLDSSEVDIREVFWSSERPRNGCSPFHQILPVEKKKKVTILVKKQSCLSGSHIYSTIAIHVKNICDLTTLKDIKNTLYQHVLPKIKYRPRGRTDRIKGCNCNFRESRGGSETFGCSKHAKQTVCKFKKIPKKTHSGRKKFDLIGNRLKNDPDLQNMSNLLADIASRSMSKFAPLSFLNMSDHAKNADSCCIGQNFTKIFGGVTFVSDYTAHIHRDAFDFKRGAVAIFSFKNHQKESETQFHILPRYVLDPNDKPGIAIDTGDNSLLLEVPVHEDHATSPLLHPNGKNPNRVALIFFRHECLNAHDHGSQL